jgi:uncharacterized RDD family membrane protein YckC
MSDILDEPARTAPRQYAGFWIRFVAIFIDTLILGAIQFVVATVLYGGILNTTGNFGFSGFMGLLGAVYYIGMESSSLQATVGKMAVGIRVGDHEGNRITIPNAVGRYFAKILSALILLFGFIMVAWDKENQGLHDKLASTYVFYK